MNRILASYHQRRAPSLLAAAAIKYLSHAHWPQYQAWFGLGGGCVRVTSSRLWAISLCPGWRAAQPASKPSFEGGLIRLSQRIWALVASSTRSLQLIQVPASHRDLLLPDTNSQAATGLWSPLCFQGHITSLSQVGTAFTPRVVTPWCTRRGSRHL